MASTPSSATVVEYPNCDNAWHNISAAIGSSSTTKIFVRLDFVHMSALLTRADSTFPANLQQFTDLLVRISQLSHQFKQFRVETISTRYEYIF